MIKEFRVKVGILTATPRGQLDVTGMDSEIYFGNAADGQGGYLGNCIRVGLGNILFSKNLKGVSGSDNFKTIDTTGSGGGYSAIELGYGGNFTIYGSNAATTADAVVTPVRLIKILGSNGNVGIGTNTPGYKLEVNGTGYFSNLLTANAGIVVPGMDSEVKIGNQNDGQFAYIGNSQRVSLGNVLFAKNLSGVPSSDTFKTIATLGTGAGYSAIELGYGGLINFYGNSAATTAGATVTPTRNMVILGNGNVGINTSPSYKLHVVGSTYFDGASQVTGAAIFNSTVSVYDVLSMNSKKITNLAAGTSAGDAVRYDQLTSAGSKWTLSGSDIYRQSRVYIGVSGPDFSNGSLIVDGYGLYLKGTNPIILNNSGGSPYNAFFGGSDVLTITAFSDMILQSNNGTTYIKVRSTGATTIGSQSATVQHALQVEGLSTENLAALRVIFRNNKNNNLQIGDAVNSWIACHNLGAQQVVDLGSKTGTVLTRVNYDFETAREVRNRFDGVMWGNLVQTSQIKRRLAGYINSDSSQTQTNCAILFNCNVGNSGTHKFLVTVEGTISGKYFKYRGIISFTSGSMNALVPAATGNDITDCSMSVNISASYPYLLITKTSGTFANTSLSVTTQATAENNNIDSQAPGIFSVVFS